MQMNPPHCKTMKWLKCPVFLNMSRFQMAVTLLLVKWKVTELDSIKLGFSALLKLKYFVFFENEFYCFWNHWTRQPNSSTLVNIQNFRNPLIIRRDNRFSSRRAACDRGRFCAKSLRENISGEVLARKLPAWVPAMAPKRGRNFFEHSPTQGRK